MASFTVDVAPTVLIWARKTAGMSIETVSRRMGPSVSGADVRAWEEGVDDPSFAPLTYSRLKSLAVIYRRPLSVFYLDAPPTEFQVPRDYRRVSGGGQESPSTNLRFELRRLSTERVSAIELATISKTPPRSIELRFSTSNDPEEVGNRIRQWLDITTADQLRWSETAFHFWSRAIEAKDILVAQFQGISVQEIRGCSLSQQPFPLLAVNQQDALGGRLFTLLHELGHLFINEASLCDLHEVTSKHTPDHDRVERFCNAVAASALMPLDSVKLALNGQLPTKGKWTDYDLGVLARRHGVSREAALLRLVTLGLATRQEYEERRQAFLAADIAKREISKNPDSKVRIPVARRRLAGFGYRYVEMVVDSFERRDITASDLSDFLDMKIDHLPKLTKLLREQQ